MFLYFPIWYMNDGGIGGLATSQASTLRTDGAPNDLMNNFNPITVMIMVPLLTHVIYPALQRVNLMPRHVTRIAFGFLLSALSSMTGFIIQFYIYRTSPCGKYATHCHVGAGVSPISVWVQVPVFVLGAMSECFCQVTAFEIAYARSPKSMKAIVMSIFLLMNAISSTLGTALTPVIRDPYLPYVWAGPGLLIVVLAMHFYWRYHWMNNDEFLTYEEEGRPQYASTEELRGPTVKIGAVTPYGGISVTKKEELSCQWARDNQDEEAVRDCRGSYDAALSSCGLARQDLRQ
jgi:dipeptide/tripeptide permease